MLGRTDTTTLTPGANRYFVFLLNTMHRLLKNINRHQTWYMVPWHRSHHPRCCSGCQQQRCLKLTFSVFNPTDYRPQEQRLCKVSYGFPCPKIKIWVNFPLKSFRKVSFPTQNGEIFQCAIKSSLPWPVKCSASPKNDVIYEFTEIGAEKSPSISWPYLLTHIKFNGGN